MTRVRRVGAVAAALVTMGVLAAGAVVLDGVAAHAEPAVEIERLTVDVDRDLAGQFGGRVDVTVRFRVVNHGDAAVMPTARIALESQIGGGTTSAPIALGELAPGEQVDVRRTAGSLLPFGGAHVTVTVRADGEMTTATGSAAMVPWLLLVVVGITLAVGIASVRLLLRRRPG